MGRALATEMLAWAPIVKKQRSMMALTAMALYAYDEPGYGTPPGLYAGGHRVIAQALGYIDPMRGQVQPSASQLNEVRKALRPLIDAGAIALATTGYHGRASEYQLIPRPMRI